MLFLAEQPDQNYTATGLPVLRLTNTIWETIARER